MTAQELRVGNLVATKDKNTLAIIDGIHLMGEMTSCKYFNCEKWALIGLDDLQPIPLSEDWLRRLGFEKPPSGKLLYKPIPQLKAEVHFEYFKGGLICVIYCSTGMFIPDDIKYVHQLQNLFFALTGQELKLKGE